MMLASRKAPTPFMSLQAEVSVFRGLSGELVTCLGIDTQPPRSAPIGKRFGVDKNAHHKMSVSSLLLLASLGFHSPFVKRRGEIVPIGHDPEHGVVILGLVPDHADNGNGSLIHEASLFGGVVGGTSILPTRQASPYLLPETI